MLEISSDDSIETAIKLLTDHRILSAPVRNAKAPADAGWYDKYQGVVDMTSIVLYVLGMVSRSEGGGDMRRMR